MLHEAGEVASLAQETLKKYNAGSLKDELKETPSPCVPSRRVVS